MGNRSALSQAEIEHVLDRAFYIHLGLCADGEPYVVPVSFVYHQGAIFFHGSGKGRKMDMLRANPRVCFQALVDHGLRKPMDQRDACNFGVAYLSVTGQGTARIIEDHEEKVEALKLLVSHYADGEFDLPDAKVKITTVVRIDVESMTGKRDE